MYKAGQVLLVKFHPSQGVELKRYRPALVVSDVTEKNSSKFVLVSPISTRPSKQKNSLEVKLNEPFLDQPSSALLWYLRAIDVNRVQYILGKISPKKLEIIQKKLQRMFT